MKFFMGVDTKVEQLSLQTFSLGRFFFTATKISYRFNGTSDTIVSSAAVNVISSRKKTVKESETPTAVNQRSLTHLISALQTASYSTVRFSVEVLTELKNIKK